MSILIAYFIIGVTFVLGFWQGYKDNINRFNAVDYCFLSLSVCAMWPLAVYEMTKSKLKF